MGLFETVFVKFGKSSEVREICRPIFGGLAARDGKKCDRLGVVNLNAVPQQKSILPGNFMVSPNAVGAVTGIDFGWDMRQMPDKVPTLRAVSDGVRAQIFIEADRNSRGRFDTRGEQGHGQAGDKRTEGEMS